MSLNAQASWSNTNVAGYVKSDQHCPGGRLGSRCGGLAEIDEASYANPTGSVEVGILLKSADTTGLARCSRPRRGQHSQGQAYGQVEGDYSGSSSTKIAPWQQDYFEHCSSGSWSILKRLMRLTFLNWESNFLVGRFSAKQKMASIHRMASRLQYGRRRFSGNRYNTWSQN